MLHELGRYSDALLTFDSAIAISPNNVEALFSRAAALNKLERYAEALSTCNQALLIRPDCAEAYSNRGIALAGLKRFEESLQSYDRAIHLIPNHAEFHYNRGIALGELKRFDEALQSNDRAIQLDPDHAKAYNHRGIALYGLKRFEEAVQSYDRAIQIKPDYAEAYSNRGNALDQLSRFAEGLENYDRAIQLQPDYADAYNNRSLSLLLSGKFDEGWKIYEWRKKVSWKTGARNYPQPEWSGEEDITGKTLFIHWEQGLGDTIQFCRYARFAEARGAKVILSVQDSLMRLLKDLSPTVEIVDSESTPAQFDYHATLLSMPFAFKTDATNIPAGIPYLHAEPERREKWKLRLGEQAFKIGIAWHASKRGTEIGRSFPIACLHGISKLPAVRLVSLQKDEGAENQGAERVTTLPEGMKVEFLGDDFDSGPDAFLDTAAVMENLDLVITADTSIAHVAGALGRPAWVALKQVPDWRWLLGRNDSPWYPTLRLFRQQSRDDWSSVFSAMEAELARMIDASR